MTETAPTDLLRLPLLSGCHYANRRGRQVQCLHQIKCGWFEIFDVSNQTTYFVNGTGAHRHDSSLDLLSTWMDRTLVHPASWAPPTAPKKSKSKSKKTEKTTRLVKVGKYWVKPGDDVDTSKPITKRVGSWVRYGRHWKLVKALHDMVED